MGKYTLALKTGVAAYYGHDDSVVVLEDGVPIFACETERISRVKHGENKFPKKTIEIALASCGLELSDIDTIATTYNPRLEPMRFFNKLYHITDEKGDLRHKLSHAVDALYHLKYFSYDLEDKIRSDFRRIGTPVPPIELHTHHKCHAASAFHPSGFNEALVLTVDGIGEYESTAVWMGRPDGLEKLTSYKIPNSLGLFFATVTCFLGFRPNNGEGKTMGLAPYGEDDSDVEKELRERIEVGADYDLTGITGGISPESGIKRLEELFGRERHQEGEAFDRFEKNLARAAQNILEDVVTAILARYCREYDTRTVCMAGGVALNCKMNSKVAEQPFVDELFVQPAADDAGAALGAGMLEYAPDDVEKTEDVYLGPSHSVASVENKLTDLKIPFTKPDDLEHRVAKLIAEGKIVGWYQGRMELGPRALGNRSILADPRDERSRDRVNKYVKGRENWRPFAPSILEDRADEYLLNYRESPFMIDTFDVDDAYRSKMEAVVHPADGTTRPQTVRKEQNPRYYELISAFEDLTGVPLLLNTSFNKSGEPIVCTPKEALRDFYRMGMDALVINDVLVEKQPNPDGGRE